jgi:hypothetical protein
MADPDHIGHSTLTRVRTSLGLDDAFTLERDDGFVWWESDVPVRFRWRAPEDDAFPVWRYSAEVDAVEGVDPASPTVATYLMMASALLNHFTMVVEDGILKFRALVVVPAYANERALPALVHRAGFMMRVAQELVPSVAGSLGRRGFLGFGRAKLLRSFHPTAGRRRTPARQLSRMFDSALLAAQTPVPPDLRPNLLRAMAALLAAGCHQLAESITDGQLTGFNAVIETKRATSLLEMRVDEASPNVGPGLLLVIRVRFPAGHEHGDGHHLARTLNAAEWRATTPLQLLGNWTAHTVGSHVAYSAFFPNALHHPELARDVALDALRRIRWVFSYFGYHEPFTDDGPHARALYLGNEPGGMEA